MDGINLDLDTAYIDTGDYINSKGQSRRKEIPVLKPEASIKVYKFIERIEKFRKDAGLYPGTLKDRERNIKELSKLL